MKLPCYQVPDSWANTASHLSAWHTRYCRPILLLIMWSNTPQEPINPFCMSINSTSTFLRDSQDISMCAFLWIIRTQNAVLRNGNKLEENHATKYAIYSLLAIWEIRARLHGLIEIHFQSSRCLTGAFMIRATSVTFFQTSKYRCWFSLLRPFLRIFLRSKQGLQSVTYVLRSSEDFLHVTFTLNICSLY